MNVINKLFSPSEPKGPDPSSSATPEEAKTGDGSGTAAPYTPKPRDDSGTTTSTPNFDRFFKSPTARGEKDILTDIELTANQLDITLAADKEIKKLSGYKEEDDDSLGKLLLSALTLRNKNSIKNYLKQLQAESQAGEESPKDNDEPFKNHDEI